MTENKQFKIVNDCGDYHLLDGDEQLGYDLCSYSMRKANWNNVVDKLNEQDERIETLKEDVEIILDYVLNKGKFAMTVKEQKAHNRLRGFVRGDVE